ncbi:lipid II:glycine glycyltransferase FemX [Phaeovulum sp.]|uniref:lipid II:glycine glycyltransferase FemX n=1 Tax=Phaeovulum sp. TaxID=2934796 RepID=UPI0039E5C398
MKRIEIHEEIIAHSEWDGLLAGHNAALQQYWAYGQIAARQGARVERASLWQGGVPVAVAQILRRRGMAVVMRGPVWLMAAGPELHRAGLRALARRHLCLLATPENAVSGWGVVPLITPRYQAVLDLRPDLPTLRARLAGTWRNRVSHAQKAGLRVMALDGPKDWRWLIDAEKRQRAQRKYRALPVGFVDAWAGAEPGGVRALQVVHDGAALAGMVFLRHGDGVSYHLGWSGVEGRAVSAHNLLLWHAIEQLKAEGAQWLDLGDVNHDRAPGLAHFKLGTGAQAKPLGATAILLPS